MKKKGGYVNIVLIIVLVVLVGVGTFFAIHNKIISSVPLPLPIGTTTPNPIPSPIACTLEAKLCPDGKTYVGRTGPNCEFAKCPAIVPSPTPSGSCLKDSDCPSTAYSCEATQGYGTACSSTDPNCVPTYTVTAGQCKLKTGYKCNANSDCVAGDLCHNNICTSPIGNTCSGTNDTSCPADYSCVEDCGPPVVRYPDNTVPTYHCQLNGYVRACPICLSGKTVIDTPLGKINVKEIIVGTPIWTTDMSGHRIIGNVIQVSKVFVPLTHQMIDLQLNDGRELFVSPGHPTMDGRSVGDLVIGDAYDRAKIIGTELVSYDEGFTYDVLPSGDTGFYWADEILVGSTLLQK